MERLPDMRGWFKAIFALSIIGTLAMIGIGVALVVWLFTHVSIGVHQ